MDERSLEDSWDLSTGNVLQDRRNLRLLTDTAGELYTDLDHRERLKRILDRAVDLAGAENGLLLIEERGELVPCCARDANGQDLDPWPEYSRRLVREVWDTGEEQSYGGMPTGKVGDETQQGVMLQSVHAMRPSFGGRPVGVLCLQASFVSLDLTSAERGTLRTLAGMLATAIRHEQLQASESRLARLKRDIADARDVQAHLRPNITVAPAGLQIFGAARICESLSGDYYDVIPRPDGRFALAIGDVKHHGIHAAVHMTTARALLRQLMDEDRDPAEALGVISRHFAGVMDESDFMTLFVGLYDPSDASFTWACAGHMPPIHRTADGGIAELEGGGPMLRMNPGGAYEMHGPIPLSPGDVLLLYTDGIVESWRGERPDREMYGEERLEAALDRLVREGRDVQRITAGLLADMDRFRNPGPPEDDVTLLVVKRRD